MACLLACSSAHSGDGSEPGAAAGGAPELDRGAFLAEADARRMGPALRAASVHPGAATRLAATRAVARLRTAAVVPVLAAALSDAQPAVRALAASGLAGQLQVPALERERILLGAYATEPEAPVRRALLVALSTLLGPAADQLHLALDSPEVEEQIGACESYGRLIVAGRAPDDPTTLHIAQLADSGPESRRQACAAALAAFRVRGHSAGGAPGDAPAAARADLISRLLPLAQEADPVLQQQAIRALSHFGDVSAVGTLEALAASDSPPVASAALRALHGLGRPAALQRACSATLQAFRENPRELAGPRLPPLLLGLQLLAAQPDQTNGRPLAEPLMRPWDAVAGEQARIAAGRALLDCAVARLADQLSGKVQRTASCGGPLADPFPRQLAQVQVLAHIAAQADAPVPAAELPSGRLEALLALPEPRARSAAAALLGSLPAETALPHLITVLEDSRPQVLAAALRSVARLASALRDQARLTAAVEAAAGPASSNPEAALAWVGALRGLRLKSASSALTALAAAAPQGIWLPASRLLAEWDVPAPAAPGAPSDALPAARIPAADVGFHVQLQTTAGTLELVLDTDAAPIAALRLVQQARGGHLDGTAIETPLPGEMVALGAELAGLGRHEDAAQPVERGSVMVEDFGRDTLTGRLLIALGREPELDGRFTVVGRVASGLEVLDRLHALDRLIEARVVMK